MAASITFEAAGTRYRLRYSNNALVELEDQLGMPITKIGERFMAGSVGVKDLRSMLWAGLICQHPELTLHDVGNIMDELGLVQVAELAAKAFGSAFPNTATTQVEEVIQTQNSGTGRPS